MRLVAWCCLMLCSGLVVSEFHNDEQMGLEMSQLSLFAKRGSNTFSSGIHQFHSPIHQCPRDGGQCTGHGASCCRTYSSSYNCCNYPTNVCCDDGLHCCPTGTVCQQSTLTCVRVDTAHAQAISLSDKESPAILNPIIADELMAKASEVANPTSNRRDWSPLRYQFQQGQHPKCHCSEGEKNATCCPGDDGNFRCCPFPKALCCTGSEYCCPQGSLCQDNGNCELETSVPPIPPISVNSNLSPQPAGQVDLVPADQPSSPALTDTAGDKCDAAWSCPNGRCCISSSYHWYCCPYSYFCNQIHGNCVRVSETEKAPLQSSTEPASRMNILSQLLSRSPSNP